jgi:hypothetical protein
MEEQINKKPNYVIVFTVPTVNEIEKLVLQDKDIPFDIMKFRDVDRYALVVKSADEYLPSFDVMSTVWLKFKMGIVAYEYDDFMELENNPDHVLTNLYQKED